MDGRMDEGLSTGIKGQSSPAGVLYSCAHTDTHIQISILSVLNAIASPHLYLVTDH